MPIRGRYLALAMALALATAGSETLGAADAKPAPDVVVHDGAGEPVRLSALKGKVVLVDFWASWCVPCKTSFPALDRLYKEYAPRGLEVLAVNVDEAHGRADAFLAAHPHEMPVVFDPTGAAPLAFGVKGMPSSYVIDKAGAIRFIHMGYSGNVDLAYRREIELLLREKP